MHFLNNKYIEKQHKWFEYGQISGAWAGDWNMPHYQLFCKFWWSNLVVFRQVDKEWWRQTPLYSSLCSVAGGCYSRLTALSDAESSSVEPQYYSTYGELHIRFSNIPTLKSICNLLREEMVWSGKIVCLDWIILKKSKQNSNRWRGNMKKYQDTHLISHESVTRDLVP